MNNNELWRFTAMPEVYCALNSKAFLSGEFSAMNAVQQEKYLEQSHKIHAYNREMEKIQNNDIFRKNMSM